MNLFVCLSGCLSVHVQAVEDRPLTKEEAGESLSLLCKTGNGLSHAYVRIDLRDKYVACMQPS